MHEDDVGLFVRGEFLESAWGDHALALVRRKLCTGLSIGFVHDDFEVQNEQDWDARTVIVKEVTLYEISLVERASDPAAGVTAVRTIRPDMSRRDIEDLLRSQGATRAAARAMASQWRPKDDARDAPPEAEAEQRDAAAMERLAALLRTATDDYRQQ
jgi:phage head maturation protease